MVDSAQKHTEVAMTSVKEFFKDKSVFITGGSGLVGQVLIEKLLRCCNVKCIYLLIRNKRGQPWQERLEKMFNNVVCSLHPNLTNLLISGCLLAV